MIIAFLSQVLRGFRLVLDAVTEGAELHREMTRRHPHLAQGE